MSYNITDFSELEIEITDTVRTWYIPKFRIYMVVDGDFCYLYWTDSEKGRPGVTRKLPLDYNDVTFGVLIPTSATEVKQTIEAYQISAFPSLSGYVPYTGATQNVDLTPYGLTTDFVEFDLNPVSGAGAGKIVYDGQTGSLTYLLNNSNVPSHIGQTLHAYVHNAEAVQINKGEAVYLFAATGNKASVKLAYNTSDATSAKTFGLAAEDISAHGQGMVITVGQLQGVNMAAYSEGDTLYLGATAGSLTNVKPYAPDHLVYIGIVEKANANGEIYVRVQNGYELDEIHDVDLITTPPSSGDVLTYNGSLWVNQAPSAGTGTVTSIATTSPITGGPITTTGTIGITQSSGAADGYLSSADWSTFNSKQDLVVSGTNIKTINGASVLGSGDLDIHGYVINVQALTSSPADNATIYFGMLPKAPTTTANISKVYIRKAGTIKIAEIYCYSGTAGTNQAWSGYVRLNNTTDTLIQTLSVATNERRFSNTALSIAVVAGDYIEIKFINPTWATNPLSTIFGGYIYIE